MSEKLEHDDAVEEHDVEAHAAQATDAVTQGESRDDEDDVQAHIKFN